MKWRANTAQKKELEQAKQELKILEDDIAAAHDFLRKNRQGYFGGKKEIPLYLLLGPSRFGKTTILAQAGLNLKGFNNQKLNVVTPTKYCSFWFSQNALYIDTAGTYTKPEIVQPRNDLIWRGFIKLLQKYFGKNAIAGVLIILDLPAIAQDINLLKSTLFCIRERVYELNSFVKDLPLHIIFTKCDRILGFSEFFSLLDLEERLRSFGIAFADNGEKNNPLPTFEVKFNELLKNLNERVIERLQKAASLEERLAIKAFPSQFGSLNQVFIEVLDKIPSGQRISLSGVYFTSSIQSGGAIDVFKIPLLQAFNVKEKQSYKLEAGNNHRYFIEDIFKKIIIVPKQRKQPSLPWPRFQYNFTYALLIAGLIVGASCIIGYQSYFKNNMAIKEVGKFLQKQPINADIDNLYMTIAELEPISRSWWLRLGINETRPLLRQLHRVYQVLFLQSLVLQLQGNISSMLNLPELNTEPRKLYDALQVYLMLGDPNKLDQAYIKNWFNNYWLDVHKDDRTQRIKLQQQLAIALQHPFKIELNQQVVDVARKNLSNFLLVSLLYVLLENTYSNQDLEIDSVKPISKMYTREYFAKVYNKQIPVVVNGLQKQDWVLGKSLKSQLKENSVDEVIKNIRGLYLDKYIAAWETTINYVPKINHEDLGGAAKDLKFLSSKDSPIIELLQQIKTNANIDNAPAAFTKKLETKLQGLNAINEDDLRQKIADLARYFASIAQSQDSDKAAFDSIISFLQGEGSGPLVALKNFSNKQPVILQTWLQSIVSSSQAALLCSAQLHINKVWGVTVVPQYQKMLVNKYPIFKDSKDDISLGDFNKFFGPHGLIDGFFNKYIKPFVNADKTNWTWKDIEGKKINFSQNSLEVFLRAALIQKMFYSNKTSEAKTEFTLTPLDMTPNTQGFTLHLDGKKTIFTNEDKKSQHFVWPGSRPELVTISFVNYQGKYFSASQFGAWAWFRMIDKSNLVPSGNTRYFMLTFDLNGNAARYELSNSEPINPFIPDIINKFRCPDELN
ncbi:MAG: hypothetical protein ACD_21C00284G0010 [uncultured bacterium]|nr:MAG: hypothetical protein ACD_21C00284G0010 [uncultured bacterium]